VHLLARRRFASPRALDSLWHLTRSLALPRVLIWSTREWCHRTLSAPRSRPKAAAPQPGRQRRSPAGSELAGQRGSGAVRRPGPGPGAGGRGPGAGGRGRDHGQADIAMVTECCEGPHLHIPVRKLTPTPRGGKIFRRLFSKGFALSRKGYFISVFLQGSGSDKGRHQSFGSWQVWSW